MMQPTQMFPNRLSAANATTIQLSTQPITVAPAISASVESSVKIPPRSWANKWGSGLSILMSGEAIPTGFKIEKYTALNKPADGNTVPMSITAETKATTNQLLSTKPRINSEMINT